MPDPKPEKPVASVVVVVEGGIARYAVCDVPGVRVVVKDIDRHGDPVISLSGLQIDVAPEDVKKTLDDLADYVEHDVAPDPETDKDYKALV